MCGTGLWRDAAYHAAHSPTCQLQWLLWFPDVYNVCVQLKELQQFPILREQVVQVVNMLLKERLPVANAMVLNCIVYQQLYINICVRLRIW